MVGEYISSNGFRGRGHWYWLEASDQSAFGGISYGARVGGSGQGRIDVSFMIHGALRVLHSRAHGRLGGEYRCHYDSSQFHGYFVENQRGVVWTLRSNTSVERVFAEMKHRLDTEGFPKARAMLDVPQLARNLKAFEINVADGIMPYDQAIQLLDKMAKQHDS